MNRNRTFDELKESLEQSGFTLSQPEFRYIVEYTENEYAWVFDNLHEVMAFVEGFETAMKFMMP